MHKQGRIMVAKDSHSRKQAALAFFTQELLTSEIKDAIAKIILRGPSISSKAHLSAKGARLMKVSYFT